MALTPVQTLKANLIKRLTEVSIDRNKAREAYEVQYSNWREYKREAEALEFALNEVKDAFPEVK